MTKTKISVEAFPARGRKTRWAAQAKSPEYGLLPTTHGLALLGRYNSGREGLCAFAYGGMYYEIIVKPCPDRKRLAAIARRQIGKIVRATK